MRALRYGESGILLELDDGNHVASALEVLKARLPAGVTAAVPGARTIYFGFNRVLVDFDSVADVLLHADLRSVVPPREAKEVEIAVTYDGEDLQPISEQLRLSVDDIVALHSGATYVVAFCGFMPGFGYLTGLPQQLWLPRKHVPRTTVPAGAVAIADRYSAVYPRQSPGGWQIIGHTDAVLWDIDADCPSLLRQGMTVRFIAAKAEQ